MSFGATDYPPAPTTSSAQVALAEYERERTQGRESKEAPPSWLSARGGHSKDVHVLLVELSDTPVDYAEEAGQFIVHFDKEGDPAISISLTLNISCLALLRASSQQPPAATVQRIPAPHLTAKIVQLLPIRLYGAYHITNAGECSWYNFAKEALRLACSQTPRQPLRGVPRHHARGTT